MVHLTIQLMTLSEGTQRAHTSKISQTYSGQLL